MKRFIAHLIAMCLLVLPKLAVAVPLQTALIYCTPTPAGDPDFGMGALITNQDTLITYQHMAAADVAVELGETETVELCWADEEVGGMSVFQCPPAWVLCDDCKNTIDAGDVGRLKTFEVNQGYGNANDEGRFYFIRTTDTSGNVESSAVARQASGACPLAYEVDHSDPRFQLWGSADTLTDPWPAIAMASPACGGGLCVPADAVATTATMFQRIEDWQRTRLGLDALPSYTGLFSWANSLEKLCSAEANWLRDSDCDVDPGDNDPNNDVGLPAKCDFCPLQGFLSVYDGLGAASKDTGKFILNPISTVNNYSGDAFNGGQAFETHSHEYMHLLQYKSKVPERWMRESTAESIEQRVCVTNFPGATDAGRCISAGNVKSSVWTNVDMDESNFYGNPRNDSFEVKYDGAIFWHYFYEQHSIPLGEDAKARPLTGLPSSLQRPADAANVGLGDRQADEGTDLLAYTLEALLNNTAGDGEITLIDGLLRERMGRSYDAMLFDMHTASMLKDYITDDPRWQIHWRGDFNAGGTNPNPNAPVPFGATTNAPAQPIPAYVAANGPLIKPIGGEDRFDDMTSVTTITGNDFETLAAGETIASIDDLPINAYGAAYLRVLPDPNDAAFTTVDIALGKGRGGATPRFRIFTVDAAGNATLVPGCQDDTGLAGEDKTERCKLDGQGRAFVQVPLLSGADRVQVILMVVSAGQADVSYVYAFNQGDVELQLLAPTSGAPVVAGTTAGGNIPRPFLARFGVRDASLNAVTGLDESSIKAYVQDGAQPRQEVDIDVADLSSGAYFGTITVPAGAFPTAPNNTLSLTIEYVTNCDAGTGVCTVLASDTQVDALSIISTELPKTANQLVLDRSGSMAGDKLAALRTAADFLIESLPNGDQLGIVAFDHDADTLVPFTLVEENRDVFKNLIQGTDLDAGGCTSIGDALFEAQSNILVSGLETDHSFNVMLLSDGINTQEYPPALYYAGDAEELPANPEDGEGDLGCNEPDQNADTAEWLGGSQLAYRFLAADFKPVISTLALGQDADLVELFNISEAGTGIYSVAGDDGIDADEQQISRELMDSFRSQVNHASGWSRVLTAKSDDFDDQPAILVEQNAQALQVSVSKFNGAPPVDLAIESPVGDLYAPVRVTADSAIFRVNDPDSGEWAFANVTNTTSTTPVGPEPAIFVESVVFGDARLFVTADVDVTAANNFGVERERWVGRDVNIRGVLHDGSPVTLASVTANITFPDRSVGSYALFDDGLHQDGDADDGVYGLVLRDANEAGAYSVVVSATGTGAVVGDFEREARTGFELHDAPDDDGDGIPNFADPDPDTSDAGGDPDDDGLTTEEEFAGHTDPANPDTDGGGESDGSEIARGSDPHDPSDDAIRPMQVFAAPCADSVELHVESPRDFARLEVQEGPVFTGPFVTVFDDPMPADGFLAVPAVSDQQSCFRVRVADVIGGPLSTWSPAHCVTPSADPYPPTLQLAPVSSGTVSNKVRIRIFASDDPENLHQEHCADVEQSGVTEVRWSDDPEIGDDPWITIPDSGIIEVEVDRQDPPGTITVQVRDGEGNESTPDDVKVVFTNPGLGDLVLYARTTLKLNDRVVVVGENGTTAHIANSGSALTHLGVEAVVDGVWSNANINLSNFAAVNDIAATAGSVVPQAGAHVDGATEEGIVLSLPDFPEVDIPAGSGPSYNLNQAGDLLPLAPGTYGSVYVGNNATLILSTGNYVFESLTTEPESSMTLDNTDGPVHIQVRSLLTYKAPFVETVDRSDTLIEYGGTTSLTMLAPYSGRYVAPDADLYLGTSGALAFNGIFHARAIEVHPDAVVTHVVPGEAPGGGASAGSCTDGEQNQGEEAVDCGGPCLPCSSGCTSAQLEAEAMSASTGSAVVDGWGLYSNGYVSTTHTFSGDEAALVVRARGDSAWGGWPHMTVSFDGVSIGSATVSSSTWQDYSFDLGGSAGPHEIRITYDNDFWWRALYLDYALVECGGGNCDDGVQNQDEQGVDCGGVCPACASACNSASYEAETMSATTGGAATGGWNIWSNGYLFQTHDFTAGSTTVSVTAKGELAGGQAPHMVVTVNGVQVGSAYVANTNWASYSFSFTALAGNQEIRVIFDNDYYQAPEDRNLIVDKVDVSCN